MIMFPGYGAQVYYNEAGEPVGWDAPAGQDDPFYADYDPAEDDYYDPEEDDA
jgi:hypothetical protein